MARSSRRLALATLAAGAMFVAILAALVVPYRAELRDGIQQKIIGRDAAVLYPEALQQLAEGVTAAGAPATSGSTAEMLVRVLKTARQDGMLAVAIYDAEGNAIQFAPPQLLLAEIPPEDQPRLLSGEQISRYHSDFPLDQYFAHGTGRIPVLEVMLPLHGPDSPQILGFVQYYIDARSLAAEIAEVDRQLDREAAVTLAIGTALVALILAIAYFRLSRAQRLIAERNERLTRANFELTLAAKASALGQITSHLIHGLQGSVAGLRAVLADRNAADWPSAAAYAERLQTIIQETVALLGDTSAQVVYPLSGQDLADTIRRRGAMLASDKGVILSVESDLDPGLDSQRGSLLCLIAANLVQNAVAATPPGLRVEVKLERRDGLVRLAVTDQGAGVPENIREHLFEPGRSGRAGGSGLGLAIGQLLARQIGATLALESTGPAGTVFTLTLA